MSEWKELWSPSKLKRMYYLSFFSPVGPMDFFWRWKRYQLFLKKTNLFQPEIIELGCGTGIMSLKMLKNLGGKAVLVDKEKNALLFAKKASKEFFKVNESQLELIQKDLFELNGRKFDLVHSQGLIEHFEDAEKVIQKHLDLVKENGFVLILAPRNSFAYKGMRKLIELVYGKWLFGFEKPVEEKIVLEKFKENGFELIRHKNFLFSYGFLAKKVE